MNLKKGVMKKEASSDISVLYVEDSDFDAFYYTSKLEQSDKAAFSVTLFKNLKDGLGAMSEKLRYDVVLLDLNLPDSEGLDTLTSVMATKIKIPVVVLSGTGNIEMFEESREIGASGFLVKKADDYDVAEHLKMVVKKEREKIQRLAN